MGTAIQSGDTIIVMNRYGAVMREFRGRLISYVNGTLTYVPHNASLTSMYLGI